MMLIEEKISRIRKKLKIMFHSSLNINTFHSRMSDIEGSKSMDCVEEQDIEELVEWLQTQPHLPQNIPDDLLESFLHSNYLNMERTKKTIETYYQCKLNSPEFFADRDLDNPGMKHILEVVDICLLPERTSKDFVVFLAKLKDTDYSKMVIEDSIKLLFMAVDMMLAEDTTAKGVLFLFDNAGVTFGHVTKLSISTLRKYINYLQDGIPVRMKAIHVINVNTVMYHVMSLVKPLLAKKLFDKIILHTADQINNLYNDIDQTLLPKDFGGNQPPMRELADETIRKIRRQSAWFKEDEAIRLELVRRNTSTQEPSVLSKFFSKLGFD